MKKITYLILLCTNIAFSQVGVNVEDVTSDFEVKGTMRLRKFDSNVVSSRLLLANDKGDVGFMPQEEEKDRFTTSEVYFKIMPMDQIQQIGPSQKGNLDLKVDLAIELNPYSETAIVLDYNIPGTSLKIPTTYIGIVLEKIDEVGITTSLDEGSRKYTTFTTNARHNSSNCVSMPITGRATDIIVNNTGYKKTVTYSVKGLVQSPSGYLHYGNVDKNSTIYGTGIFMAQVYERKIK